jgi:hypothetical protein
MRRLIFPVIVLVLAVSPASSAEQPRIAVLTIPSATVVPGDLLVAQDALIAEAFKHSGAVLPWQLIAFSPPRRLRPDGEVMGEVERMVEEGKTAYRYLKLPDAQTTFQAAAGMLQRIPLARCNPKVIADLYFYWARAALDSGEDAAAQQLLAGVTRFDPKAGPDPATMPPNLVATYDIALDDLGKKAAVRVPVEIGPGQGSLVIDCTDKPVPATVEGRAGETFWLAAQIEGGTFRGSFPFLDGPRRELSIFSGHPGDDVRIGDRLQSIKKGNVTLSVLKTKNADLDDLASILGVDVLLLGEVHTTTEGKALYLAPYVPGQGMTADPFVVPLSTDGTPDPDKLAAAFSEITKLMKSPTLLSAVAESRKLQTPPAMEDISEPLREPEEDDRGSAPFYKTWWFWTATGAVVVGAVVTGVLLGISGGGDEPSGKVILSINPP